MEVTSILKFLAVVLLCVGLVLPMTQAQARTRPARACRFDNRQAGTWTTDEVRWTVRCLADWMNVSVDHALYVADRESHFHRFAWNHSSDCRGIYQHMYRYWWSRVHTHADLLRKFAVRNRNWYSPRAQAVVTFAMVKKGGWGPWEG